MSITQSDHMTISVSGNIQETGEAAADEVAGMVANDPAAVLGVATGSSPLPLYHALARRGLDFSRVTAFALDEYVGIPGDHPQSYTAVVREQVTKPLRLSEDRVHIPKGSALDLEGASTAYEAAIRAAGGIDLQILGIGSNGHIGFNEPGSPFHSRTREVVLAGRTRKDNARFFDGSHNAVPERALTQGLATIFEARHLLLIAHGPGKAESIERALKGPVTEDFPASLIQLHPRVSVFLDVTAADLL